MRKSTQSSRCSEELSLDRRHEPPVEAFAVLRTSTPIPRRGFYFSDQAIIGVAICRKPTTIRSSRLALGGAIESVIDLDE
jgi:hypothetical protein